MSRGATRDREGPGWGDIYRACILTSKYLNFKQEGHIDMHVHMFSLRVGIDLIQVHVLPMCLRMHL